MDTKKLVENIQAKPPFFVIGCLIIFLGLIFLKWNIHLPFGAILFLLGGIVGIYFLDIADLFFAVSPSPFRTMVFTILLGIVGFFIMSSTQELLAKGLVLSLNFSLFFTQLEEWKDKKNLDSWYALFFGQVPQEREKWGLIAYGGVVVFLTGMFLF